PGTLAEGAAPAGRTCRQPSRLRGPHDTDLEFFGRSAVVDVSAAHAQPGADRARAWLKRMQIVLVVRSVAEHRDHGTVRKGSPDDSGQLMTFTVADDGPVSECARWLSVETQARCLGCGRP